MGVDRQAVMAERPHPTLCPDMTDADGRPFSFRQGSPRQLGVHPSAFDIRGESALC